MLGISIVFLSSLHLSQLCPKSYKPQLASSFFAEYLLFFFSFPFWLLLSRACP